MLAVQAVEQPEQAGGLAAEDRAGKRQGVAAGVDQVLEGRTLVGGLALEGLHLVGDQEPEEAGQALADVARERPARGAMRRRRTRASGRGPRPRARTVPVA